MLRRKLLAERSNERVHPKTEQAEYSPEDETKNQIEKDEYRVHVAFPQLSFASSVTPARGISFYHRQTFSTTFCRSRAKTCG